MSSFIDYTIDDGKGGTIHVNVSSEAPVLVMAQQC